MDSCRGPPALGFALYQSGDRIWLRNTGGEMLARLIDPDARSGVVIWLIEAEGGSRPDVPPGVREASGSLRL